MPDPLNLARCRALADEAEESLHSIALLWQEMQAAMRRREPVHPNDIGNDPITVSAKAAELATALRAACDEVERLRGENSGLQGVLRHLERKAWGGDTTISGFRKWVAERCGAALPPCDLSSQGAP